MDIKLPEVLAKHMDLTDARPPVIGYSPEMTLLCPYGYDGKKAVLKTSRRFEVKEEGDFYAWLEGKLPVPKVYFNEKIGKNYYLVVSWESGQMLSDCFLEMGRVVCLKEYGRLLAQIHQVDLQGIPYEHDRAYKMEKVYQTIKHHEAKTQYFERELQNQAPEALYDYLVTHQDFSEDLVFCHGDVCFPNFIYENHQLKAVLDVSGAGINDRHLDIAIALRTLRYNFEMVGWTLTKTDIDLFLEAYGIENIDMDKITFYIFLDELTNG